MFWVLERILVIGTMSFINPVECLVCMDSQVVTL